MALRIFSAVSLKKRKHAVAIRSFAVYGVGRGWSGAFGTERFDQVIPGHDDEEELDQMPIKIIDGETQDIALGWGHTAIITRDNKLLIAGRPHDFAALLKLHRLPKLIRDYAVQNVRESDDSMQPNAILGRLVTWLADQFHDSNKIEEWELAKQQSVRPTFEEVLLPDDEVPISVAASAGLTAVLTRSGKIFTFGINQFGQCGTGKTSNHVWQPSLVTGLSAEFADRPRKEVDQTYPIADIALGLQHGICRNNKGEMFCWGKGERGQLGQGVNVSESHTALPVSKFLILSEDLEPEYLPLGEIVQIDAGMLHCAALTSDGRVLIWGKHILPQLPTDVDKKIGSDARLPYLLSGLPDGVDVERISCGSHHTSVLLSDGSVYAVGISSDTKEPILEPVQLLSPGIVELPVTQFEAHMDRTTVVGQSGRQVLQVHLWKEEALREYAIFTPSWVEVLLDENPDMRVKSIHRSWMHSVAITT